MRISILTLFPGIIEPYIESSIVKKARDAGKLTVELFNIRDYSSDRHRCVDDYPFGGGAGMVMMPQPIFDCVRDVKTRHEKPCKVVFMSPAGRRLDNRVAREFAGDEGLIILCGHYEGVDQRVIDNLIDEEISIGDYVLTGGELAAMVFMDAVVRFIPGVLGNENAHDEESFEDGLLEYPQYTRPADFEGLKVPDVLLSGHHENIGKWRRRMQIRKTLQARPDLLEKAGLSGQDAETASNFPGDTGQCDGRN